METNTISFSGAIPMAYDQYLGRFIFDPFAFDLIQRLGYGEMDTVLELGCGTGRLTKQLRASLNESAVLTSTDINPDMLTLAQEKVPSGKILWDTVNMTAIPYREEYFDLVICQFGLMFVPDKRKALAEMFRVLKKGG